MICTGRHGLQHRGGGRLGTDACLIKPVPEERLASLLEVALEGGCPAAGL